MAGSRIVTVRGQGRRVAESCYLRYPHLARIDAQILSQVITLQSLASEAPPP